MKAQEQEKEIDVLATLAKGREQVNQRDLSRIIGLSLGMTNIILKRLARKGFLQIRKVNNRSTQYVISSRGMQEIATRSYSYLRRTIKKVVYYKETLSERIHDLTRQGFAGVVLIGQSDLDFIVEYACGRSGCLFRRADSVAEAIAFRKESGPYFLLFSERWEPKMLSDLPTDSEVLAAILAEAELTSRP